MNDPTIEVRSELECQMREKKKKPKTEKISLKSCFANAEGSVGNIFSWNSVHVVIWNIKLFFCTCYARFLSILSFRASDTEITLRLNHFQQKLWLKWIEWISNARMENSRKNKHHIHVGRPK